MSTNLKLIEKRNNKSLKAKLKKIEESDGFIALTLKREGFSVTFGNIRNSISDEEIIYAMENLKLKLLLGD